MPNKFGMTAFLNLSNARKLIKSRLTRSDGSLIYAKTNSASASLVKPFNSSVR
jgi:hypothetical protein